MLSINKRPGVVFMSLMVNKYFTLEDLNLSKQSMISKWIDSLVKEGEMEEGEQISNYPINKTMDRFDLIYLALKSRIISVLSHERC